MGEIAVLAAFALVAVGLWLFFRSGRTAPPVERNGVPPLPPHDRAQAVAEIERKIHALESRAAALQVKLDQLPDEDSASGQEQDESDATECLATADWTADACAPAFAFGPANIDVEIDYAGSSASGQQRRVTVQSYRYDGPHGFLNGYCHWRRASRTFLFSRIKAAREIETGDPITDLGPWLHRHYEITEAGIADAALEKHRPALDALFYVAKADRAFRAAEKQIVRHFLIDEGVTNTTATAIIDQMTRWEIPSAIAYGRALRQLNECPPDYRRRLKRAAEAMVASDKSVHPTESRALARLVKELSGS